MAKFKANPKNRAHDPSEADDKPELFKPKIELIEEIVRLRAGIERIREQGLTFIPNRKNQKIFADLCTKLLAGDWKQG